MGDEELPCGLMTSQVSDLLFRDITPEDYDLLILLDEQVKKPTASDASVKSLPVVGAGEFLGETCTVCLFAFEGTDTVVELPCGHFFHRSCIAKWLMEQRRVCPLCGCELSAK